MLFSFSLIVKRATQKIICCPPVLGELAGDSFFSWGVRKHRVKSPLDTPRRQDDVGFSTGETEQPTSPVSEAAASKLDHVIPTEPPRPLEELGMRERVEWDITRYRAIFQLGNRQSLIASKSFRGELKRKQQARDPKDVTLRAKSITGAWAVNLGQQLLVCDEDSDFNVSIEELFAFEELLDIWERRSREVSNQSFEQIVKDRT